MRTTAAKRPKRAFQQDVRNYEDIGTTRLVARARRDIAAGALLIPKRIVDRVVSGKTGSHTLARLVSTISQKKR